MVLKICSLETFSLIHIFIFTIMLDNITLLLCCLPLSCVLVLSLTDIVLEINDNFEWQKITNSMQFLSTYEQLPSRICFQQKRKIFRKKWTYEIFAMTNSFVFEHFNNSLFILAIKPSDIDKLTLCLKRR